MDMFATMKNIQKLLVITAALFVTGGDGIQAADPIDSGSDKQLILDGFMAPDHHDSIHNLVLG